jgi:hypothetical protein
MYSVVADVAGVARGGAELMFEVSPRSQLYFFRTASEPATRNGTNQQNVFEILMVIKLELLCYRFCSDYKTRLQCIGMERSDLHLKQVVLLALNKPQWTSL